MKLLKFFPQATVTVSSPTSSHQNSVSKSRFKGACNSQDTVRGGDGRNATGDWVDGETGKMVLLLNVNIQSSEVSCEMRVSIAQMLDDEGPTRGGRRSHICDGRVLEDEGISRRPKGGWGRRTARRPICARCKVSTSE